MVPPADMRDGWLQVKQRMRWRTGIEAKNLPVERCRQTPAVRDPSRSFSGRA